MLLLMMDNYLTVNSVPLFHSGNDWRLLAEKLGCRMIQIDNWMNKESPTQAVLTHAMREDVKLGNFIKIVIDLERPDVVEAIQPFVGETSGVFTGLHYIERFNDFSTYSKRIRLFDLVLTC